MKKRDVIDCMLKNIESVLVKVVVISGVFLQLSLDVLSMSDYRTHKVYEVLIAIVGFYIYMYANFSGINDVSIRLGRADGHCGRGRILTGRTFLRASPKFAKCTLAGT